MKFDDDVTHQRKQWKERGTHVPPRDATGQAMQRCTHCRDLIAITDLTLSGRCTACKNRKT